MYSFTNHIYGHLVDFYNVVYTSEDLNSLFFGEDFSSLCDINLRGRIPFSDINIAYTVDTEIHRHLTEAEMETAFGGLRVCFCLYSKESFPRRRCDSAEHRLQHVFPRKWGVQKNDQTGGCLYRECTRRRQSEQNAGPIQSDRGYARPRGRTESDSNNHRKKCARRALEHPNRQDRTPRPAQSPDRRTVACCFEGSWNSNN